MKKNDKASAAQATVQAKTKGRRSKQDGKILTVVAIHKKSTNVVAHSPGDREMDGKSITINRPRANPSLEHAGGRDDDTKSYERKGTKTRWTDIDSGCNSQ